MRKRILSIFLATLPIICLSACANTIPKMDEEQQKVVVEYAASALLKYDKNSGNKLLNLRTIEQEENAESIDVPEETLQETLPLETFQLESTIQPGDSEVEIIDNTEVEENSFLTIEDVLELDDIRFHYIGYETDSFYPNQSEELNFVMSATKGNSLLVLRFQAENLSDSDMELDMGSIGARYKIVINGEEKNVLTTMLLEDMVYFKGTLLRDETKELVLICEIPQQENVSSLDLIVKNVDNIATISLH